MTDSDSYLSFLPFREMMSVLLCSITLTSHYRGTVSVSPTGHHQTGLTV